MNDPKLNELLKEWRVSGAPASLDARVLGKRQPWWGLLLTGSIRIPMPVALAMVVALLAMAMALLRQRPAVQPSTASAVNLADFRPVQDLNVRIIRGHDDAN